MVDATLVAAAIPARRRASLIVSIAAASRSASLRNHTAAANGVLRMSPSLTPWTIRFDTTETSTTTFSARPILMPDVSHTNQLLQPRLDSQQAMEVTMKPETTDQTIEEAVRRELEWDPAVTATHIDVTARDGAVCLTGNVPTYAERMAAVAAAERIYGVCAVADDIEVKRAGTSAGSDAKIAEAIARQLRANTRVPDTVQVEVRHGFVTLQGTVEWRYQSDAAERPLEFTEGICSVTNLIEVKPRVKSRKADVESAVHEAIGRLADLDARAIGVSADNGTVRLDGHVRSAAERRLAEQAAASAPGVKEVANDIVVTP
jgi:osmotically-inducible protein OsmY